MFADKTCSGSFKHFIHAQDNTMFCIININQIIIIIPPLGRVIKFLYGSYTSDFPKGTRSEFYLSVFYCQICHCIISHIYMLVVILQYLYQVNHQQYPQVQKELFPLFYTDSDIYLNKSWCFNIDWLINCLHLHLWNKSFSLGEENKMYVLYYFYC